MFEVLLSELWRIFEYVLLPWSQLTSVMQFPAFDVDALSYLCTMTELTELNVLARSETHHSMQDVISLPKLCCLSITEDKDAAGCSKEFIGALAIPALSKLTLDYHNTLMLHFPMLPLLPCGNLIKLDIACEMNSHDENTQELLDFLTVTHHIESLWLFDTKIL